MTPCDCFTEWDDGAECDCELEKGHQGPHKGIRVKFWGELGWKDIKKKGVE